MTVTTNNIKKKKGANTTKKSPPLCPDCGSVLQKCLIQQNYAMVICPDEKCGYPFNQRRVQENLVYVDDSEVIPVAKQRLSDRE
ncbi:hypothetical protein NCAS_0G02050 [Naumovozyma castellii]|uniref:Uncharacterized protein n=1 Tax=Naumovozyma castellii TaxID=27288 RepID=G0VI58_NAUCA|nr:hypothetical protein NCAS_0G02050 [Naumovozyma castellii CBS 4309]CCC71092.1 hypothetical protein NCAS_0G02050 [Naumovozyma castellii CBS 4309]